jgi:hypothetical protein
MKGVRWEVSKQPQREGAVAISDLTPTAVTSVEADEALRSPAKFDGLLRQRTVAHAFSRELLLKYVLNAMYQLSHLVPNKALWMGALGSHVVEHYVAELRRLMGGGGNADDAVHAAVKGFVHRLLVEQLRLRPMESKHRASVFRRVDSGR